MLAGVQRIEVRNAVHAEHNGLAVEHEPLLPYLVRRLDDPRVSLRPVITAAGDQPHVVANPFNAKAVAVILDLVKPVGAVRDDLGPGGQAELKHAPKIGIRSSFAKAHKHSPADGERRGRAQLWQEICDPPPKLRRM